MPESALVSKPCTVCGVDCAGRARVKDQQGRYMCQECFERAKQTKQVQKAPPPAPAPTTQAGGIDLRDNSFLLDIGSSSTATKGTKACPECARALPTDAVICIGCGYNLSTGKRMAVKVERAKKVKEGGGAATAAAELGSSTVFCIIGGLIGGGIGAALWAAVGHFTGYEVGYVAWAVGGLAGAGCSIGARAYTGIITGVIACIIAIAAIVIGKWIVASQILNLQGSFAIYVSFWDILWVFLALGTAFKVGSTELGQGGD